jgi:hypothetical protein
MTAVGPWRNEHFESMSWHDVHVHGLRFATFNEEYGAADVALDIDYILRWEESEDSLVFKLCPAELVFHDVFALKLELDYATPTAGMCPFSIDSIHREEKVLPSGAKTFRWRIDLNWPYGSIEFDAPTFSQRLTGSPVVKVGTQYLSPTERSAA